MIITRTLSVPFVLVTLFGAGNALAAKAKKECALSIDSTDQMAYSVKELTIAPDCTDVKLTLKHIGKLPKLAMGHNWVLTKAADQAAVAAAGAAATAANDYLPKDDKRVIAHTKMLGGGESDTITFNVEGLKAGEAYKFFCSFPGHVGIMNGVFAIK